MELITEEKINNIKRNAERYYHIGNDVVSEGIFERFWPLAPFASEKYFDTSRHKKLLLVGESNYMDESEYQNKEYCVCSNPSDYYHGEFGIDKLVPENKIIAYCNDIGYKTFNLVFGINTKVLKESFGDYDPDGWLGEASFYNFCLRPAVNQNGKKMPPRSPLDKQVEFTALKGILEVLKPDIVVILSAFVKKELEFYAKQKGTEPFPKSDSIHYEFLYHPSRWNMFKEQKTKYESILREHWINK